MMVVFFSRSDISLSGTGLALGIVAIGGMLAISFISFITQKQPDQTAEDRQALRTVCALVTGKLATGARCHRFDGLRWWRLRPRHHPAC